MNKNHLKLLGLILLCAAVLLALTLGLNGVAAANARAKHLELMKTLLPGSESFTTEPCSGEDASIRSVHKGEGGFVIETVTRGYADEITMYVGVSNEGKVTGLVVWEAHETFGLGSRALTDHEFLAQFLNSAGSFEIAASGADAFSGATNETPLTHSDETVSVDAITGATVTSKAVVRCVNSAVAYVTGADASSAATSWGG